VRFWHLTFQEYLAALELAWRGDGEDEASDWWPVVAGRLDDAQWRETVELLPGCLFDEGGEGRVDRLLTRVLNLRGPDPELAEEARVAGIVGRLLQPLSVYGYKVRPEVAAAYEESLERSMAIFTVEGAAKVPAELSDASGHLPDGGRQAWALRLGGKCLGVVCRRPFGVQESGASGRLLVPPGGVSPGRVPVLVSGGEPQPVLRLPSCLPLPRALSRRRRTPRTSRGRACGPTSRPAGPKTRPSRAGTRHDAVV